MNKQWELDREYLEHKFTDPEFFNGTPGIPMAELIDGMMARWAEEKSVPRPVVKAECFALLLNNMQFRVSNCDYFPAFAACMSKPLRLSIMDKWHKETLQEVLSPDEYRLMREGTETRTAHTISDFEHTVPDWDAVLRLGFSGLLARSEEYARYAAPEKQTFYRAIRIEYTSILNMLDRLIAEAEKLDPEPKGALLTAALKQLRTGSAGNFYEALLQIWLYFQFSEYVDVIQTRSLGNLDRVLYHWYRNDLDSGRFTEAEIRYFIRSFLYQLTAMHYKVGHPFYFGGSNEDGSSTINELSFLILDEYDKMGIFDPKLHIKVSPRTPVGFVDKALDMIRRGSNSIAFVGEPCIIRTMLRHGYSLREGQTADIKGCYEYCAKGGTVETAPVTINTVKVLGLVLHNGIEVLSGKEFGMKSGELSQFTTFGKLYKAFLKQLFFICDRTVGIALRREKYLDRINPAPMISATFESSLQSGEDGYARGARYNNSNLWLCGAATTADALTMICRYVYERRELTLPELVKILDADFEGHEPLRQKLLNDPEKFGNNLDLPDRIAYHFTQAVARRINGRPNSRGGIFTTSLHASNRFFQWADMVEASADGRKRGDELSKNMTAMQGAARNGATALIASVLKFDTSLFMADFPVDIMFHPSEVRGDGGLAVMRTLLMTYINNYGHAIHFNVMDVDILRDAQKNPEKYRDLQVRICGWNVLWTTLPKKEQDAYIRQAENF